MTNGEERLRDSPLSKILNEYKNRVAGMEDFREGEDLRNRNGIRESSEGSSKEQNTPS